MVTRNASVNFGTNPEMLMPFPKQIRTQPRIVCKRSKCAIISDILYKKILIEQSRKIKVRRVTEKKLDKPKTKKRGNKIDENNTERNDCNCLYGHLYSNYEIHEGWIACSV